MVQPQQATAELFLNIDQNCPQNSGRPRVGHYIAQRAPRSCSGEMLADTVVKPAAITRGLFLRSTARALAVL